MVVSNYILTNVKSAVLEALNTNITHLAVGDDNTAPTSSDTTLANETYREAEFESSVVGDTLRTDLRLDVTENNGNTMIELGSFNASSGGTMYHRILITSISKDSNKSTFHRTNIKLIAKNA